MNKKIAIIRQYGSGDERVVELPAYIVTVAQTLRNGRVESHTETQRLHEGINMVGSGESYQIRKGQQ